MDIRSPEATPSQRPPAAYFTGTVWLEPLVEAPPPARLRAVRVRFDLQTEGQAARTIRAGDVVWIPPGEKHWHGAAPNHAMTHLAMQEALDGVTATWLEPVSAPQYEDAARVVR